jgi:uncharacterized RDD family membrane protein YckC
MSPITRPFADRGSRRARALAWAADTLFGAAPLIMAGAFSAVLLTAADAPQRSAVPALLFLGAALSLACGLAVGITQALREQPTVGRRLAHVTLVRCDGRRLTRRRAVVRELLRAIAFALLLTPAWFVAPALDLAVAAVTGRGIRDRIIGTRIVAVR